jgi:Icc-related predicted phosphoesterase
MSVPVLNVKRGVKRMIIDCISDLHGFYPKLEGGDLLIVAGDLTKRDEELEYFKLWQWMAFLSYKKIIIVPGNHDNFLQKTGDPLTNPGFFSYLCDSGTEFESLKIWGSPWTLTFPGMNPRCKAFTVDTEEELAEKFALIPDDVDILVTHGPPHGIMDEVKRCDFDHKSQIENTGSVSLCKALARIRPKLHIFGHIHEGRGYRVGLSNQWMENYCRNVLFLNCSHVDENYKPVNEPIRVTL